jgi:putative heme-binding domain-containing protein
MRAYGERFQPDELWRVVAFLRSTSHREVTKSAGDSARGEALFWGKGGCGNCHLVGARGNRIGPDLTNIGRRRGLAYLRAALLTPDQDITGGYESVTVITKDGKTLRGIQRALDDFSVQFMDMQGNYYSFDQSQVQSVKSDVHSLMPSYDRVFNPQELDDSLAYLLSLRGKETSR